MYKNIAATKRPSLGQFGNRALFYLEPNHEYTFVAICIIAELITTW
jgi:hypothetical protein